MSNCIKNLYDYGLVKKCSKCEIAKFKSNFHEKLKSSDGLFPPILRNSKAKKI